MSDPLKKVQPGQRLNIPAEAYNAFIDAARAERSSRHDVERAGSNALLQSGNITIRNQTDQAQQRFSILALGNPIVTPADNLQQFKNKVAFDGLVPTNPLAQRRFAILCEPLAAGAIGRAVITGVTPVVIGVANEDHQYASPLHNVTTYLQAASSGLFRILWKESGVGLKWAVVAAEPSTSTSSAIVFQLTTDLSPGIGQVALGEIVASSNATEYPLGVAVSIFGTGQMRGRIGARGVAIEFGGQWWTVDLNQPAILARFLFTGSTHSPGSGETFGAAASQIPIAFSNFTAISPYPFSGIPTAPIANPSNLIAFAGDSGLCVWDEPTQQYVLINVYSHSARRFYFKLLGSWPNGLDQTYSQATCLYADTTNHGGNLVSGSITLRDRWNVASNAKSGDIGICQLNYKTSQFDIVEISHVFTVGRGKVSTAFSGTPSTFAVTDVLGFDGRAPVGTLLTVDNELKIDSAKANDLLELRWNAVTGKFYALPSGGGGRVFAVLLSQSGGSQGTASAAASWRYNVLDYDTNSVLLSNANPVTSPHRWKRPSVGQMSQANFGYAHYDSSESGGQQLVLGWINEVAEQQACQVQANAPIADFPTSQIPAIDHQAPLLEPD